jgi:hypothetical protein
MIKKVQFHLSEETLQKFKVIILMKVLHKEQL